MLLRRSLLAATLVLAPAVALLAQEGFPLFTTDFPPEEFAARRAKVYEAIGTDAFAVVQGAPSPPSYTRFRQSNELYYLCGVEVPHAYLLLDGRAKKATLFLPNRNEGREKGEGKVLSAEDADEVKKLSGVDAVASTDVLAEQIENRYARQGLRVLYTPLAPAEGGSMSRDLALRFTADAAADPFDGRPSREGNFTRPGPRALPVLRDQGPLPDARRAAPDQERAGARGDPQGHEARGPRDPREHAVGPAGPVRAGARRRRQVRLLPQRRPGRRVLLAHRQRPQRLLAALQRRQAEDGGRRLPPDGLRPRLRLLHGRRHADVPGQREVLAVAARALRLLPRVLPRDPQGDRSRQDRQGDHPAGGRRDGARSSPPRSSPSPRIARPPRTSSRATRRAAKASIPTSATGSAWPRTTSARTRGR